MQLPESPCQPPSSTSPHPSLHHLAQCNTPLPVGSLAMVLSLQPLCPHTGPVPSTTFSLVAQLRCLSPPPPPCRFYGRTDFKTMKLQTLCVLILSGGSMYSAPVVWCVTIQSAASSGTECRLSQTQSHGHLCNCAALLALNNICSLGPPSPSLPPVLLFTLKSSL